MVPFQLTDKTHPQDVSGCRKSGKATFSRKADECFPPQNCILLRKTPRPTGKTGRYDESLADGELLLMKTRIF